MNVCLFRANAEKLFHLTSYKSWQCYVMLCAFFCSFRCAIVIFSYLHLEPFAFCVESAQRENNRKPRCWGKKGGSSNNSTTKLTALHWVRRGREDNHRAEKWEKEKLFPDSVKWKCGERESAGVRVWFGWVELSSLSHSFSSLGALSSKCAVLVIAQTFNVLIKN